jgi:hypothetical protein
MIPVDHNHAIKLTTRRLPQIRGYSYPRVTAIRIDVHPAGENPTNMTRTLPAPVHVRSAYASYGRFPYVATFHKPPTELNGVIAPDKRAPDTIPSTLANRFMGPYPVSLPSQPIKHWRKSNIHQQQTTTFTRPISPAYDRCVQYLLMGAN